MDNRVDPTNCPEEPPSKTHAARTPGKRGVRH
jgi:hypothetical protein